MAQYRVTAPDGQTYNVTGPDGASNDDVLAQVQKQHTPVEKTPAAASSDDSATGFVMGNINKGISQLAGLPVETAKNAVNLGIAGYGAAKGALGGTNLPEPIESPVGGANWFEEKMKKYLPGSITPSAEPTSTAGRYVAAALQNIPLALVGGEGTAAQLPAKGLAAITSGAGSELGGDIGGHFGGDIGETTGRLLGSMSPTPRAGMRTAKPPTAAERAAIERKTSAFEKAKEVGRPVLPSEMKIDKGQVQMEDVVNKELGQPSGAAINQESLANYRKGFEEQYSALVNSPELANGVRPTQKFRDAIDMMGDEIASLKGTMPETFKSMAPVEKLLRDDFGYGNFPMPDLPPKTAIRVIRKLRDDATRNLMSDKPEQMELGRAQRKIAISMEDMIEDNVASNPELLEKMRNARTLIAKSYDVESSLDKTTRKLRGDKLSQLLSEGKPLSGDIKKLAEVAGEFPKSTAQENPEDFFTHKISPWAAEHPKVIAGNVLSRGLNKMKESAPYQAAFVDPSKKLSPEQEKQVRLQAAIQAMQRQGNNGD